MIFFSTVWWSFQEYLCAYSIGLYARENGQGLFFDPEEMSLLQKM